MPYIDAAESAEGRGWSSSGCTEQAESGWEVPILGLALGAKGNSWKWT